MTVRACLALLLGVALLTTAQVLACCPAPPGGKPVANADQAVIIVWDAATQTQHFIRRASFKSEADDFGFLVPTPSQPALAESGNDAFPYLQKLTEPEVKTAPRPSSGISCGCPGAAPAPGAAKSAVRVLDEKDVAGLKATVLEADSAKALVKWLGDNGYAFSSEVEAWAKPYIERKWKITALKVAKPKAGAEAPRIAASALRLSFKTDRPLFPYREPDYKTAGAGWLPSSRLLRIYFIADARYAGTLTPEVPWTGKVAWAGKLDADSRHKVLAKLNLPQATGPAEWWLTGFEDPWPYRLAPADVYFAPDADQGTVKRPPIIRYVSAPYPTDVTVFALAAALVLPPLLRRVRGSSGQ